MLIARPEDQTLVCVARRSLDADAAERLYRLLRSDLDWQHLLAMAQRHCLIPLLHYHLNSMCPGMVPAQILSQLRDNNDQNTRHSLFLTGELLKLMDLLEANGIRAIPFKGPTLALCAYGDVGLRQFGDLDILVHRQDVFKVKELLVGLGFKPTPVLTSAQEAALLRFDCAYAWGNDKDVLFDVHWNFAAPYFSFDLDVNRLWDRLEPITIGSRKLPTIAPEDLLLILCLHGSTHFWDRLGWICDIASLIESRKDIDWQMVLSDSAALGNQRMLSLGLFLAGELLDAPIPQEVWQTVQADAVVKTIAEQVQQRLFAPERPASGIFDAALLHLRMRERMRDKLRSCLRLATTPRSYDWLLLPLPVWLFSLYYLLRPLRLAGKYGMKFLKGSDDGGT